jgi:hypothetical protein
MKELIGKKISKLFVNEDQSLLKFETDTGDMVYYASGDCCSESWFADILIGYKFFESEAGVEEVERLVVPDWVNILVNNDRRNRQEFDSVYGFKITKDTTRKFTGKPDMHIIFRNSSNGYYGGECYLIQDSDVHQNAWAEAKIKEAVWTQITEDWRA